MKCQVCGNEADHVYEVWSDGVKKTVAFCNRCEAVVLRDGGKLSHAGLQILLAHSSIVQESVISHKLTIGGDRSEVFVRMPVAVLRVLFERDQSTDAMAIKEVYERRMFLLQKKLEKAVKNEDYKQASRIKKQIQKIKEILEKK